MVTRVFALSRERERRRERERERERGRVGRGRERDRNVRRALLKASNRITFSFLWIATVDFAYARHSAKQRSGTSFACNARYMRTQLWRDCRRSSIRETACERRCFFDMYRHAHNSLFGARYTAIYAAIVSQCFAMLFPRFHLKLAITRLARSVFHDRSKPRRWNCIESQRTFARYKKSREHGLDRNPREKGESSFTVLGVRRRALHGAIPRRAKGCKHAAATNDALSEIAATPASRWWICLSQSTDSSADHFQVTRELNCIVF